MLFKSEYENLIDINNSFSLRNKFLLVDLTLNELWMSIENLAIITEKAIMVLHPLQQLTDAKLVFQFTSTKNKIRSKLYVALDLSIQLSDIKPNFSAIKSQSIKQFHFLH